MSPAPCGMTKPLDPRTMQRLQADAIKGTPAARERASKAGSSVSPEAAQIRASKAAKSVSPEAAKLRAQKAAAARWKTKPTTE